MRATSSSTIYYVERGRLTRPHTFPLVPSPPAGFEREEEDLITRLCSVVGSTLTHMTTHTAERSELKGLRQLLSEVKDTSQRELINAKKTLTERKEEEKRKTDMVVESLTKEVRRLKDDNASLRVKIADERSAMTQERSQVLRLETKLQKVGDGVRGWV